MNNTQKVTKEEVCKELEDGNWHTKGDIAASFGVSGRTISKRVTDLIKDEVSIINGQKGLRIVKPSDVVDNDIARDIEKMTRWIIGIVTRQALSAKPMKKLMTKARALLPRDAEEKAIVRKYLVQLTHLIDWDEATDD